MQWVGQKIEQINNFVAPTSTEKVVSARKPVIPPSGGPSLVLPTRANRFGRPGTNRVERDERACHGSGHQGHVGSCRSASPSFASPTPCSPPLSALPLLLPSACCSQGCVSISGFGGSREIPRSRPLSKFYRYFPRFDHPSILADISEIRDGRYELLLPDVSGCPFLTYVGVTFLTFHFDLQKKKFSPNSVQCNRVFVIWRGLCHHH